MNFDLQNNNLKLLNNFFDYKIVWRTHDVCNIRCPYCFQNNKGNDINKFYPIIDNIICKLNSELKEINNKKIEIAFMGGEPTLIDLKEIISKIEPYNNIIYFKIFTNFTASEKKYKEIFKEQKENKKIGLSISIHDDVLKIDLNKLKNLKENIYNCSIVIATKKNYINYLKYKYLLEKIGVKLIPQKCKDYSTKQITTPKEFLNKVNFFSKKFLVNNKEITREELQKNNLKFKRVCNPKIEIYTDGKISDCSLKKREKFFTNILCERENCQFDCINMKNDCLNI